MNKILILGAFLIGTVTYSQNTTTVFIEGYRFPIKVQETSLNQDNNVYIVGDYNKVQVNTNKPKKYTIPKQPIQKPVDKTEYNKSLRFNPKKTISEILKQDKK